jgi:hypothetical protein
MHLPHFFNGSQGSEIDRILNPIYVNVTPEKLILSAYMRRSSSRAARTAKLTAFITLFLSQRDPRKAYIICTYAPQFLKSKFNEDFRVSVERIVSNRGLSNVYEFLSQHKQYGPKITPEGTPLARDQWSVFFVCVTNHP